MSRHKKALNEVNRVERGNALFALFVILTVLVVTGLCGFIYYKVKKSHMVKTAKTKFSDDPLEQMLLEGNRHLSRHQHIKLFKRYEV